MISQALGSENLLAFHRVRRSLVHVPVDVEPIVLEAPFIDDNVGSEDGCLDVFQKAKESEVSRRASHVHPEPMTDRT